MRKLCIVLCLSLFVSLIHAGSVPAPSDFAGKAHAQHLVQHDCHTKSTSKVEKSQSTNHQTHHQCCLGVVADLSSNQYIQPESSTLYASLISQLIVEAIPAHIFKPPRPIS